MSASPAPLDVLRSTVGSLNKLPTLPDTATRAMEVANSPKSSLGDFAAVIQRDPPLAAGVLKLANSALYQVGRTLDNVHQAVVRLGLRECKNLLIAVGMRSLLKGIPVEQKRVCEILWRHSFVTGCLARRLNKSLEFGYQGEEFSCGLSHDIGRILFAIGTPTRFAAADPVDFDEGPNLLSREQEVLGTDHCSFGAWFCENNRLPASLGTVARFHHAPTKATNHQNLVGLIALADHMANHLQRTGSPDGYDSANNPHWPALSGKLASGLKEKVDALAVSMLADAEREARDTDQAAG